MLNTIGKIELKVVPTLESTKMDYQNVDVDNKVGSNYINTTIVDFYTKPSKKFIHNFIKYLYIYISLSLINPTVLITIQIKYILQARKCGLLENG